MSDVNQLLVIEQGKTYIYTLDERPVWEVGRMSKDVAPDICLNVHTVSRRHGSFQNMDGNWFYIDRNGKNGTTCRGRKVGTGIGGRTKPVMLKDGDVLVFGGGENGVVCDKTALAVFCTHRIDSSLKKVDTKQYNEADAGTVIKSDDGLTVVMGDYSYIIEYMI